MNNLTNKISLIIKEINAYLDAQYPDKQILDYKLLSQGARRLISFEINKLLKNKINYDELKYLKIYYHTNSGLYTVFHNDVYKYSKGKLINNKINESELKTKTILIYDGVYELVLKSDLRLISEYLLNVKNNELSKKAIDIISKYLDLNSEEVAKEVLKLLEYINAHPFKSLDLELLKSHLQIPDKEIKNIFKFFRKSSFIKELLLNFLPHSPQFNLINGYFHDKHFTNMINGTDPVVPEIVELHIGKKCPFKCTFCIQHIAPEHKNNVWQGIDTNEFLSTADIIYLINNLANHGTKKIIISGSGDQEPLTNSDIGLIIDFASALGISVSLYSNGLNANIYEQSLLGCYSIRFSMISPNKKTYSQIARVPEVVFDRVTNNIKNLINLRNRTKSTTQIGIHMVITEMNYGELEEFINLGTELAVDFIDFRTVFARTTKEMPSDRLEPFRKKLSEIYNNYISGKYGHMKLTFHYELANIILGADLVKLDETEKMSFCNDGIPGAKLTVSPTGHVYLTPDSYAGILDIHKQDSNPFLIGRVTKAKSFFDVIESNEKKRYSFDNNEGFDPWVYLTHKTIANLRKNKLEENLNHPLNFISTQESNSNVVVIGVGYWGEILVNTIRRLANNIYLTLFAGTNYAEIINKYSKDKKIIVKSKDSLLHLINDNKIFNQSSKAFITTQGKYHYGIAKPLVDKNIDIFIEKPLTERTEEANNIQIQAEKSLSLINIDHIFINWNVFKVIENLIKNNQIGNLLEINIKIHNVLPDRKLDSNALFDWGYHILYLLANFIDNEILSDKLVINNKDISFNKVVLSTSFNNINIHVDIDRAAKVKERILRALGSKGECHVDFSNNNPKLEINNKSLNKFIIDNISGDLPLDVSVKNFIDDNRRSSNLLLAVKIVNKLNIINNN